MITGVMPSVKVPLLDLKAQFRQIRSDVLSVMEQVCDEQGFILGRRVEDFESAMAGVSLLSVRRRRGLGERCPAVVPDGGGGETRR